MRAVVGVALAASALLTPFGGKVHRKTEEGNRAYERAEYERALLSYTEAQQQAPVVGDLELLEFLALETVGPGRAAHGLSPGSKASTEASALCSSASTRCSCCWA